MYNFSLGAATGLWVAILGVLAFNGLYPWAAWVLLSGIAVKSIGTLFNEFHIR